MSSIPAKPEKKPDSNKALYATKLQFSTERKTARTIDSNKKSPSETKQPLAKSQTNLHFKGRKQSALKKNETKPSKGQSSAAILNETRNEKSPRDKASRRLADMQKDLLRRLTSQTDKGSSLISRLLKHASPDNRKAKKPQENESFQPDSLMGRMSYKSMSSMSSEKKNPTIFDQTSKSPQINLFGDHFQKLKKNDVNLLEYDKVGNSLKSILSFSKYQLQGGQHRTFQDSTPTLFQTCIGKPIEDKKTKTSMQVFEVNPNHKVRSLKRLESFEDSEPARAGGNFKKCKLGLTSQSVQAAS
jgi:hypothetical protein